MTKDDAMVRLEPELLRWARKRASMEVEQLAKRLNVEAGEIRDWERSGSISMLTVEDLARQTHTPIGYLYLKTPPDEVLPIADLRVRDEVLSGFASPELLDTVYQMQRRQAWMREDLIEQNEPPLSFAGAYDLDMPPTIIAAGMLQALGLGTSWAENESSWIDALSTLRDCIESAGILVFFNSIVGNSTTRRLDPGEFQGFALADDHAPLVFVNSADFKTAQIFTLAHELAHVFVGLTGVSRLVALESTHSRVERLCSNVAAEFLVSETQLRKLWDSEQDSFRRYQALAVHFKVSTIVVARRALDLGLIDRSEFLAHFEANKTRAWGGKSPTEPGSGDDFWSLQRWRVGHRFSTALTRAIAEGRLSFTEAYSLADLRGDDFAQLSSEMESR